MFFTCSQLLCALFSLKRVVVNVNITLICKNILYISKSNVALCSIYHYNTLSTCICCIKIHTNVSILVIVDSIFYVT